MDAAEEVEEVPVSASPTPSPLMQTRHKCHRMEPWGDICEYDNVCFDGDTFYYFTPQAANVLTTHRFWSCTCANGSLGCSPRSSLDLVFR
jgi:hypothetical protein